MKIDKFIELRIAFLFEDKKANRSVSLAKKIAGNSKTYFVIDNLKYIPHVTIYNTDFPKKDLNELFKEAKLIASKYNIYNVTYKNVFNLESWIGIKFIKTKQLFDIRNEIVKKLNQLRENHIPDKYLENWSKFSEYEKKKIKKYGYVNANSEYFPHLSLLRLEGNESIALNRFQDFAKKEFKGANLLYLAITETAEHGVVTKILRKYKLNKKI